MKNIFKTIVFAFCVAALGSCEDDPDPIVSANGFLLRSADAPSGNVVLVAENEENIVATLNWDKVNNGTGSDVSSYTVEVAPSGTNFSNPVTANAGNPVPTGLTYELSVKELNEILNDLPSYVCGQAQKLDVRVRSVLGRGYYNEFVQYSNVIALELTPYSLELPTMFFGTAAPAVTAAGNVASSGVINKDYEGYMWLEPGLYKFYKSSSCGTFEAPVVYGDDNSGSFNALSIDGAAYQVLTAGFYLVKADLQTSLYSVRAITWNFFGTAKPVFPNANTPLTYNATTKLWETDFVLSNGYDFQFRSNGVGEAALILGGFDATKTGVDFAGDIMSYKGTVLVVPGVKASPRVNTRYHITLDLNSPRNYNFSIVANPL